ncbi:MAG: TrpB-like pyridoxal phosphate-dependent enzyme [Capsulimonadaceae bacterium]|nr:TrpB-like pyridoxal phosphate-dependent enzyme [Capsulimonadaceae bacterium]
MPERRIYLPPGKMPTAWYNVVADMKTPPAPYLHPGTRQPVGPDDLSAIFPDAIIGQEVATERYIDIPGEVIDAYNQYRPSPLHRALRLEQALGTKAKIYYKYEGVSPAGSHKPNSAIPQAFYNKKAGIKRLATETGAGQWGSSLALACNWFGLECTVYMVKVSYFQKPYRRTLMRLWGAEVFASPSDKTNTGREVLAQDPESNGSLGIAISEAVEDAAQRADTNYALGSVLNHVLLHQTVIGQEAYEQLKSVDEYPDIVIGCCGGGSNFGGIALPFIGQKLRGEAPKATRFVGAEPAACPTLTRGEFRYDFGDVAKFTPLVEMYTLGHTFMPAGIHAGGLRYHGMSTIISRLAHDGIIEPNAYTQNSCFSAAEIFAKCEGIVPAPESSHAIRAAIDEAILAKAKGTEPTILFCLSGHGFLDLASYESYIDGNLTDFELPEETLQAALAESAI